MTRRRRSQDVRIWRVQDRSARGPNITKPHVARWVVDGREFTKSFPSPAPADSFRSQLITARDAGEQFDVRSGLPESWEPAGHDLQLHVWARSWVAEQWPTWAPRTRATDVYALARFLPLVTDPKAPDPPATMRRYLCDTLPPGRTIDRDDPCERWLSRWVLTLGELSRDNLAAADLKFAIGARGKPLAPRTLNRQRTTARAFIRRAVDLQKIPADPWPPKPKGTHRRKANLIDEVVDVRKLPAARSVADLLAALDADLDARELRVMTEVIFCAGLRPSEVAMLRPQALDLPKKGWGRIRVDEADDGHGQAAAPKTGRRQVPIPEPLTETLQGWIGLHRPAPTALLFTAHHHTWRKTLRRGCRHVGIPTCTPYTFRHVAATLWIRAGVPLAEVARRLGHSVEMLVSTYIGAMDGDEADGNMLIDAALASEGISTKQ